MKLRLWWGENLLGLSLEVALMEEEMRRRGRGVEKGKERLLGGSA